MLLVTGGAGFIGSNLVHRLIEMTTEHVVDVDNLTYAGNLENLAGLTGNRRHIFVRADIGDAVAISQLLAKHRPKAVVNLAAESHVDRSIHDPEPFIQTNVVATLRLLKTVCAHWRALADDEKAQFRFVQVSTDEVYGSLDDGAASFRETTAYAPNSPYAASKASSDHLVRAFHHTYGVPTLTTNGSNTYGPYQFPEKLIPVAIHNALADKAIPVYGDGNNVRDWLYVADHCSAIQAVLAKGRPGESYNIGASDERTNIEVVELVCKLLDEERPRRHGGSYRGQITHVKDRPGHDRRYSIDATKARVALNWAPQEMFVDGMRKTVRWYLDNQEWIKNVTSGAYNDWVALHYRQPA
jgi:dTDP-glucose 4,6-dehydratase